MGFSRARSGPQVEDCWIWEAREFIRARHLGYGAEQLVDRVVSRWEGERVVSKKELDVCMNVSRVAGLWS